MNRCAASMRQARRPLQFPVRHGRGALPEVRLCGKNVQHKKQRFAWCANRCFCVSVYSVGYAEEKSAGALSRAMVRVKSPAA